VSNMTNNAWRVSPKEGQHFLVVPVNPEFAFDDAGTQRKTLVGWQKRAEAQGLTGELFLVFDSANGALPFPVLPRFEEFCKRHAVHAIRLQCNVKIDW
jgi:hypothetical protein